MRNFACRCAESAPDEQADRIREAWRLLRQIDAMAWGAPSAWPRSEELEGMLASGAYESAVTALLGPEVGFILSRGGRGICLATVMLPGSGNEVTAEAGTLALALLTALASALLDHIDLYGWPMLSPRARDQARPI